MITLGYSFKHEPFFLSGSDGFINTRTLLYVYACVIMKSPMIHIRTHP